MFAMISGAEEENTLLEPYTKGERIHQVNHNCTVLLHF